MKCRYCGKEIKPTEFVLDPNASRKTYFCSQEHKDAYLGNGGDYELKLYDYIWIELMDRQGNFSGIKKQLNKYKTDNGWKWSGMFLAAKYWHEVMLNNWDSSYSVGQIFEFGMYDDACKWYTKLSKAQQLSNEFDYEPTVDVVEVNLRPNRLKEKLAKKIAGW